MMNQTTVEFCADSVLPKKLTELSAVCINKHGRLQVIINNETLEYPVLWLRQNCQCKECFNPICLSYIYSMRDVLYKDLTLKSVKITNETLVECIFMDDHKCLYTAEWLYNRRMTLDGNKERADHLFMHKTVPWPEPKDMVVQKCSYQEVTTTDDGFEKFGNGLIRDGIFVITDSPDRHVAKEFGDATGLMQFSNHYGMSWRVKNDPSPTNHAFTTKELELHIDQPYLADCPSIQLLHCLVQSKTGGDNVMCDGIKAAMLLRERHPEYYKLLTTLKIQHEDVIALPGQPQYYMAHSVPTINVDENGEPAYIRWCHPAHSSFFPGTVEDYEAYITALKEFYNILSACSITIKNNPGDIMVFDNQRVMHGRLGYNSSEARELEGWYVGWDFVHSKLRVVKIRKAKATE